MYLVSDCTQYIIVCVRSSNTYGISPICLLLEIQILQKLEDF